MRTHTPCRLIDNTRSTSWVDPRRQDTQATAPASHLGPLPSGWEMRLMSTSRIYFVDYNTNTTTWDDPRLPSSLDTNVPQHQRDFRRKLIYFRSQPAMRGPTGNVHIKARRNCKFEDYYAAVMRQNPNDLKKTLRITFEGEPGLDYRANSRCVASVYNSYLKGPSNVPTENSSSSFPVRCSTRSTPCSNTLRTTTTPSRSLLRQV